MMSWKTLIVLGISMLGLNVSVAQSHSDLLVFDTHHEAPQNTWFSRPKVNPAPQKTLLLTGMKDARLEVWFKMEYTTQSKACESQNFIGRTVGAPEIPQVIYDSVRVPAGQTKFSISFFLDRYIPGRCDWRPSGVLHSEFEPAVAAGPTVTSGVVAIRAAGNRNVKLMWRCRRDAPPEDPRPLECQGVEKYPAVNTPVSSDGGVVQADFTLATDDDVR
ncbi:hypothetical protein [Paraburkholderia bannensis]|uniref:hypothetical protein n=1 Tax=Paraburkholderia bannensis TaxID=765414 RepID=UPI002AC355B1|nr:hypothetical protein [Paraburkholderia bannensis]